MRLRIPTSTPDLPLLRTRFVLLVLTQIFFIVSGSLCLKIFTKHGDVQDLINRSVPPGVTVKLEYNDVKTATIVLFIATHLGTALLSKIIVLHLQQVYNFIPLSIAKRMRIANKRLASSTLSFQAASLGFLIVFNAVSLGFFSFYTFTREQKIKVVTADNVRLSDSFAPQLLERLGIAISYRDTHYIRITAEIPWIAVFLAVPTMVVTAFARHRRRPNPPRSSPPSVETLDYQASGTEGIDEKKMQVIEVSVEV